MLRKHLEALASPRHGADQDRPGPLRLGTAFCEYIETHTNVPDAGGLAATIVITMTLEDLLAAARDEGRVATLDTADQITTDQAIRLLTGAEVIPAFLAGPTMPLDLGRSRRLFSKHQRLALALKYAGCAEEHCDATASRTHAHHLHPWSRGGHSNLDNAIPLCTRHHTLAHDRRYQMKTSKNGRVAFTRRT